MEKIKLLPVGAGLEVERALTAAERRKMLDAADLLSTSHTILFVMSGYPGRLIPWPPMPGQAAGA